MPDDGQIINRTRLFILSFQLEGLCAALRATIPPGHKPTHATIALLKKLYDDFDEVHTGQAIERFPPIDEALAPMDVLTIAETLRATVAAFMTPEEREERHKEFGFAMGAPRNGRPLTS